ncbi:MAG: ATP-binding cassette domain-containing protein, partial [Spirochaetaceae bacterium]|nr:ATP-binding cassette domain-containing protein [Spirochaetaceae bacterium]
MIELRGISKTFRGKCEVHAVKNVSLTVEAGEIFGVIGFSGAGKSTLVRCINLLEQPDQGEVLIKGRDITKLRGKELRGNREDIGMIFQHFNLFRSRT